MPAGREMPIYCFEGPSQRQHCEAAVEPSLHVRIDEVSVYWRATPIRSTSRRVPSIAILV